MTNQIKDKCPICGGYLFDDDDIVYCPVCGAPHHRDCWKTVGHCGLAQTHGTQDQYKKPREQSTETENPQETEKNANVCSVCGKETPSDAPFCPYCGTPSKKYGDNENANIPFAGVFKNAYTLRPDPYGGLDKNSELDGVKVSVLARFVSFAPNKLLPKFKAFLATKKRACWNWMGFLSPCSHALFRKMHILSLMYILTDLIGFVLLAPFYYSLSSITMPVNSTTAQLMDLITQNPLKYFTVSSLILAVLGVIVLLGVRIFAGLFDDWLYMRHCTDTIKKIKSDKSLDFEEEVLQKGGVRPFLGLLLFSFSVYFGGYIPAIISGILFG